MKDREKTKDKKGSKGIDSCCPSEDFQSIFEMMRRCCEKKQRSLITVMT